MIGSVAGFVVLGAWSGAFHCDESNVFRHVTRFRDGDWGSPGRPGFLWLLLSPSLLLGSPVASALAMRLAAAGASLLTLALVYRLVADDRPDDRLAPLLAIGLLGTSMSWQAHAFEVRTDTFVVPMTLLAAWLVFRPTVTAKQAALAGLALGAATVFSQKTVYNLAALGAAGAFAAWSMRIPRRQIVRTAVLVGGTAAVAVGTWYAILVIAADSAAVSEGLGKAARNAWGNQRALPVNLRTLGRAASTGLGLYVVGGVAVLAAVRLRGTRPRAAALAVVFGAMLATIAVHRGFFPYFIASFEPYLAVAAGGLGAELWHRLRSRGPRSRGGARVLAVVVVVLSLSAVPTALGILSTTNHQQLKVMREADALFGEPVPHWDSSGLIAGYPETTFFNTAAVRRGFRERQGADLYIELARERKPLFLIRDYMTRDRTLRAGERQWLWRHFLPYRDNLYLRGGRVAARADEADAVIELATGGDYTVHFRGRWSGVARVNGEAVADGATISLSGESATLTARASEGRGQLWLLVGADRVPAEDAERIDWSMFPTLRRGRHQSYDHREKGRDLLTQPHQLEAAEFEVRRERHRRYLRRYSRRYEGL